MALTSYQFEGVELNDAQNYLIPFEGSDFDGLNEANVSYGERQENTPVYLGSTLQSGQLSFVIQLRPGTPSEVYARLTTLKRIFNTTNQTTRRFRRKRPLETSYAYLDVAPQSFSYDPINYRATVVLHTADRRWKAEALKTQTVRLFDQDFSEVFVANNAGTTEVYPTLTFTFINPWTESPQPQFWHEVSVFYYQPINIINMPVCLTNNWDTTSQVAQSFMRADGLDIDVRHKETGRIMPSLVFGTTTNRLVWVRPTTISDSGNLILAADITSTATTIKVSRTDGKTTAIPLPATNGKIMIGNELIHYTTASLAGNVYTLTGCSRGQNGTTAGSYILFTRVKVPATFQIRSGYGAGWERLFPNNLNGWLPLDYNNSTNSEWQIVNAIQVNASNPPTYPYQIGFAAPSYTREPTGSYLVGTPDPTPIPPEGAKATLWGAYFTNGDRRAQRQRIVQNIMNLPRRIRYFRIQGRCRGDYNRMLKLSLIKGNFGTFYEPNSSTVLWQRAGAGDTELVNFDTGNLFINQYYESTVSTHWSLEQTVPQFSNAGQTNVVVDRVYVGLEQAYGEQVTTGPVSDTLGVKVGQFPFTLKVWNVTVNDTPFHFSGIASIGTVVTIDTDFRTLSGAVLDDTSFTLPMWLRLVPGDNAIRITGEAGAGEVDVTVTWRELQ